MNAPAVVRWGVFTGRVLAAVWNAWTLTIPPLMDHDVQYASAGSYHVPVTRIVVAERCHASKSGNKDK
jgi:hypothetical protein